MNINLIFNHLQEVYTYQIISHFKLIEIIFKELITIFVLKIIWEVDNYLKIIIKDQQSINLLMQEAIN